MPNSLEENLLFGLKLLDRPAARPEYAPLPTVVPDIQVKAVYFHVPFCTHKCHYCDFYSLAGHLEHADAYLDALAREIDLQLSHFGPLSPETVFIGGGTPTLLDPSRLAKLLKLVSRTIAPEKLREFTVEANPNTFCTDRARVLVEHGVNRISFGAQSFVPAELSVLQRDHQPENVGHAVGFAREAGVENLNIDLIFGTPGQTLDSWDYSLRRALELQPEHLSCYSLIYEPNTPMTARMHRGEFAVLDEELELSIFQHTYDTLRAAGFQRYEISNYARPERECRHNLHYWKGDNFLAFGPAAAGGYAGCHWKNVASLGHYLSALSSADGAVVPVTGFERLSPVKRAGELMMLWMRLTGGVNYAEFLARTGVDTRRRVAPILERYAGEGLLIGDEKGVRFTEKGVVVSDAILREILGVFGD